MRVANIIDERTGVGSGVQSKTLGEHIDYFEDITYDQGGDPDKLIEKIDDLDADLLYISSFDPQLISAPGKQVQVHRECGAGLQNIQPSSPDEQPKLSCPKCDKILEEEEVEEKKMPKGAIYKLNEKYPTAARVSVNEIEMMFSAVYPNNFFLYGDVKRAMREIDVLIPSSEPQRKQLLAQGYRNTSRPIYPAIDIDRFKQFRDVQKPDLVSFVSRVDPIKSAHINAIVGEIVCHRVPSAQFWLCGNGTLHNQIDYYAKMNFRNNRIKILGEVEQDKIYSSTKVLVQMSLSENHSLSVLEARAAGIPVVASDVQGHVGNISRVGHERIEEATNEVVKLLTDQEYYNVKRREGYEGLEAYRPERITRQYDKLFRNMMQLKRFKDG